MWELKVPCCYDGSHSGALDTQVRPTVTRTSAVPLGRAFREPRDCPVRCLSIIGWRKPGGSHSLSLQARLIAIMCRQDYDKILTCHSERNVARFEAALGVFE